MTDLARNSRTLMVCFSLAILALIPLRFVEISQQVSGTAVLGETEVVEQPAVVLPSAEVEQNQYVLGELEVPYTGATDSSCMTVEMVNEAVARINEGLTSGLYPDATQAKAEAEWLNSQLCK